jgi:hypothetical protein
MSNTVTFVAPDGSETVNPDRTELIEALQTKGPDYWETGSGDAGLNFQRGGNAFAEMIVMVRKDLGVFVQHLYCEDGNEYVLSTDADVSEEVTIDQGGEPWTLPKAFFVPNETAADAIAKFCETGERVESLKWVEFL